MNGLSGSSRSRRTPRNAPVSSLLDVLSPETKENSSNQTSMTPQIKKRNSSISNKRDFGSSLISTASDLEITPVRRASKRQRSISSQELLSEELEAAQLQELMETTLRKTIINLQTENNLLQKHSESLKQDNHVLQSSCRKYETIKASLEEDIERNRKLYAKALDDIQLERAASERKILRLKEKHKREISTKNAEITRLRSDLETFQSQIEKKQQELAYSESKTYCIPTLESEIKSLLIQLDELNTRREENVQDTANLSEELEKTERNVEILCKNFFLSHCLALKLSLQMAVGYKCNVDVHDLWEECQKQGITFDQYGQWVNSKFRKLYPARKR